MSKIKTNRKYEKRGMGIMLQLNNNTLMCIYKRSDRMGIYYDNDTFSNTFNNIKDAKLYLERLCKDGYFGKVLQEAIS